MAPVSKEKLKNAIHTERKTIMNSNQFFKSAKPIWIEGKEKEWNISVRLLYKAEDLKNATLTMTGAAFYQVTVGDTLLHFGPAKKADKYTGVDVIQLPEIESGVIEIKVAGYYVRSYNGVMTPSFIQAEIEQDGKLLASTGNFGFECCSWTAKPQKTMRYSTQRQFSEVYDLALADEEAKFVEIDPEVNYIPRRVPLLEYDYKPCELIKRGRFGISDIRLHALYQSVQAGPIPQYPNQYPVDELVSTPWVDYLKAVFDYSVTSEVRGAKHSVEHWAFDKIQTGFIKLSLNAKQDSRVIVVFAEQTMNDRPYPRKASATNCIEWKIPAGEYTLYSFEPYTVLGMEIMIMEGEVEFTNVGISEFAYSSRAIIPYTVNDPELAKVYEAAVDTFRHNAVDIYMDCPSRERAGWLFDSYYTGKSEFDFTGKTLVEDEFLNNYLLGGTLQGEFEGMVHMCYPATANNGRHIPQWSMWYILELYEYFTVRGRGDRTADFKDQLYGLLGYFKTHENELGLLEKLPSWNFVEWSALNQRVHDVSWPTNMLYAQAIECIAKLYNDDALMAKAEAIRETVRSMAFNGTMFLDRAMRQEDGSLKNTSELSETTQYYALMFGVADINDEKYAALRDLVYNVFGKPVMAEKYPNIEPSNALPGLYMRTELMLRWKMYDELVDYIKYFFLPMAEATGTLWEHKNNAASCDHGFASYIGAVIKVIQENK